VADWVYEHHELLELVLAIAVVVAVATVAIGLRRHAGARGFVWVAVPVAIVVAVGSAWLIGDRRSNAAELQQRLDQVAALLPSGSTRTAADSRDNHRSETFSVPGDASLAGAEVERSAAERLPAPSRLDPQFTLGGQAIYTVLFPGDVACDGAVQVTLGIPMGPGRASPGTTAIVTSECRSDLRAEAHPNASQ
jgi:hypothetical protein